ncbi:MAG: type II CRISPR RNA-guided endonuclease Cas9 [Clostridiales bacterium]|nr:type II CRISPR RNA-guided endonuclease Cas9 [Clostridiales bacterium]
MTEIQAVIPETGEITNIIGALWRTNYNLMQLISNKFGFIDEINKHVSEYYDANPKSITEKLEDMFIPNAVKRPIFRTLDIVKEIKGIMKQDPKKIFIEMARAEEEKKRTKSRKEQITELYKNLDEENREIWSKALAGEEENRLKSERLFLYYMQLGKCMYTGEVIDLSLLSTKLYDIDHIYPQSKVKDDSVHNNKVLVLRTENAEKKDEYSVAPTIQRKMTGYWNMLAAKGLITKEKFSRLTRSTGFSNNELTDFINRQLVETRQSTKAVAILLQEIFPNSEIVYVKAGLVSDFRNEYDMVKSRELNDLHHAKDAYLNIVIGNVYNVRFTKNPVNFIKSLTPEEKYSINIKAKEGTGLLARDIERNGEIAWRASGERKTIETVKKTVRKNNINYVRYAYCRKGGFFNQNAEGATQKEKMLIPRKQNLPADIYGGYNNTTASFFTLVKHMVKGKPCISVKPVELLVADKFINDDEFALSYCKERLGLENPDLISHRKVLKVNTMLSLDGFRANIAAKSSGGSSMVLAPAISLVVDANTEKYIKNMESVLYKYSKRADKKEQLKINEKYDKITKEENERLYQVLKDKLTANIFAKVSAFGNVLSILNKGESKFMNISIEEQVLTLMSIVKVFKTGRTTDGCDLTRIGGAQKSAILGLNATLSATKYKSIEIIDQSSTGLFEKTSGNLLEL